MVEKLRHMHVSDTIVKKLQNRPTGRKHYGTIATRDLITARAKHKICYLIVIYIISLQQITKRASRAE